MGCTGDIDLRTKVVKGTMVNDRAGGLRKAGHIVCIQIQKSGRRPGRLRQLRETNNSVTFTASSYSRGQVVVTLAQPQTL